MQSPNYGSTTKDDLARLGSKHKSFRVVSVNKILGDSKFIGQIRAQQNIKQKARLEKVDETSIHYRRFHNCKQASQQISYNKLYHNKRMQEDYRGNSLGVSPRKSLLYEDENANKLRTNWQESET